MPVERCQPRKMSLAACMSRCPATTRWPWLAYRLFPTKRSSTDSWASFAWRNSGSGRPVRDQDDPGAGADAADADDLAGDVDVVEVLEQVPPVGLEGCAGRT